MIELSIIKDALASLEAQGKLSSNDVMEINDLLRIKTSTISKTCVRLEITEDTSVLASRVYGQTLAQQVKPKLSELKDGEILEVVIPERIELISMSFVDGFIAELSKVTNKNILDVISIQGREKVKQRFYEFAYY